MKFLADNPKIANEVEKQLRDMLLLKPTIAADDPALAEETPEALED